ncbi:MAG: N-acetylneuraminate synthase family protein [Candidatus Gastranaerophilales bacterium]|nr:N-acetylneuraminate synthase family protein [Candidatus Gastranaerophilales bacterium]
MSNIVSIGGKAVGDASHCFVIAEIGINHNGCIKTAKKLIDLAAAAGCDAVKFQKRTVDIVYTPEELAQPRVTPLGKTNGDLKRGLEFGYEEYKEIDRYCKEKNILWFASCWDEQSVDFIDQFNPPCYKISSASLTDDNLLKYTRAKGKPILLSTGMSTIEEIDHAVEVLGTKDLIIYHCTSTYPTDNEEVNLSVIPYLKERYGVPIGFSGHERGLLSTILANALGACSVERHITLDRTMWGSDQAASIEPVGLYKLMRDIRNVHVFMGNGQKTVYESEKPIIKKLRRVKNEVCLK